MRQQQAIFSRKCVGRRGFDEFSYPAHNLIEVCQMGLASLTTKDLVGSQVNVV